MALILTNAGCTSVLYKANALYVSVLLGEGCETGTDYIIVGHQSVTVKRSQSRVCHCCGLAWLANAAQGVRIAMSFRSYVCRYAT